MRPALLIVDPDAESRRSLAAGLAAEGYEVIPTPSAEEGRRFVAGLGPSVVVAPVGTPGFEDPAGLGGSAANRTLLLLGDDAGDGEDLSEDVVYLAVRGLPPGERTRRVRLALVGREVGLDPDAQLASLVGDLSLLPFPDLVQRLSEARLTGRFRTLSAEVLFEEGRVVAAALPPTRGVKAFCRIARSAEGPFRVEVGRFEAVGEVIHESLAELLDLARDEAARDLPPRDRVLEIDREALAERGPAFAQLIKEQIGPCRTVGEVMDRLPVTDAVAVETLRRLLDSGVVRLERPRAGISVLTDSTADLPPRLAADHGIEVIPLSIVFGADLLRDGVDLQARDFYELLETSEHHPSTRPPTEDEFHAQLQTMAADGDVLGIHLSATLSQTLAHARGAAQRGVVGVERAVTGSEPRIELVDSRSVSLGLGLQALFAARMVRRGCGLDEIRGRLDGLGDRIHVLFVVDTLEYLQRGGRIGKAQAWIGSLLGIKPILGVEGGQVVPVDKVRGGRRAHPRIVRLLADRVDPKKPLVLGVAHSKAPVWADRLRQLLEERFEVAETILTDIGPVVGTHAGPGCVGCVAFQPTDEELELFAPLA